ncbi:hypothetical protein J1N35_006372 [Gossypium stocksii]|uniref:Uncharacterized protein n=1 Tax=Gossypium stocksii TaxID=47602 RepID=A0A9D4AI09_9ROSI|nr:hypothetical protein J1N35_006372 [Gossypium stocksii]
MEHAILFDFGIDTLDGLCTYWTCVQMTCRVCASFSEFFGRILSETVVFPKFLQAGSVTLLCELILQPCHLGSRKVPASWICSLALQARSPCCLLVVGSWVGGLDPF